MSLKSIVRSSAIGALLFLVPLFTAPVQAADCSNVAGGVANGECVKFYSGQGCQSDEEEGSYKPTCGGNCFQYGQFQSLHVSGDGTYGTDCYAYSDSNCQNLLTTTGNQVVGGGTCTSFGSANSMKCYYRC
jgi:hypothetical protein